MGQTTDTPDPTTGPSGAQSATSSTRREPGTVSPGVELLPFDGFATHYPAYFPPANTGELFKALAQELNWRQERARLFGRTVQLPRLTAWHGSLPYSYSGVTHAPCPPTSVLVRLQADIVPVAPGMNCVLANLYRDGHDSMSWHADNELLWGPLPTICSVSFGATRRFLLKHRASGHRVAVDIADGDVLIMSGTSQEGWLHAIPKTTRPVEARINLTFRRHY